MPSPALVVDLEVLESNLDAMARLAADRRTTLRPHAKTHKSPPIARRQLAAGAVGLSVATIGEAEVFLAHGCEDLFVAYPLWVDAEAGRRLRQVGERALLAVGVDSPEGAANLARRAGSLRVLVEVDSGHHRSGVTPLNAGPLAVAAGEAGHDVLGVFTFPGHSYGPGAGEGAALAEADALREAAASLVENGLTTPVRSGGSTPSAAAVSPGTLSEIRPGVYVFGDAQQWELGTTGPEQIALTCHATVVSRAGGRVVLDAGSKVLGADRAPWASGGGRLLDHPDARIGLLSEHHAVVTWDDSAPPALGDRVRVVPNHVCNAVKPRRRARRAARGLGRRPVAGQRPGPPVVTSAARLGDPGLVILDCDGVLVDSERLTVEVEAAALTELGWPMTSQEVVGRWMGRSSQAQLHELEERLGAARAAEFDRRTSATVVETFRRELTPVDGVPELLTDLRRCDVPFCVASSGTHERLRFTLGLTGLWPLVEGRVFSAVEVAHGKPAPDLFWRAAARMGVEPDRCVVVEDSVYGVEAGVAAGMRVLGYAGGLTPAAALREAGAELFSSMRELFPG